MKVLSSLRVLLVRQEVTQSPIFRHVGNLSQEVGFVDQLFPRNLSIECYCKTKVIYTVFCDFCPLFEEDVTEVLKCN